MAAYYRNIIKQRRTSCLNKTSLTLPPTLENIIREKLTGKTQQNALDYVAFMKANGIMPHTPESSVFVYSGGYLCNFMFKTVDNNFIWDVSMEHIDSPLCRHEYQDYPVDEKVKEFAWAHVSTCYNFKTNGKQCGCGFHPGRRVTLFGKEFIHTCHGLMGFPNPDGEELELLKKLTVVWKQVIDDVAKKDKPHVPKKNEWLPVRHTDTHAGRPLGNAYTKSLYVEFFITPQKKFVNNAAVGFSGGGLVPTTSEQIPVALHIGVAVRDMIVAYKGPEEGYTSVEKLRYQQNVTYLVEMSLNITDNTYDSTIWMLDANGRPDTPYYIAKDYPFRLEAGAPSLTAIDTIYPVFVYDENAYIIKDFKVVGGE